LALAFAAINGSSNNANTARAYGARFAVCMVATVPCFVV